MSQIGQAMSQIGREPELRPVGNPCYTPKLPVPALSAGALSLGLCLVRDLLPSTVSILEWV